MSEGNSSEQWRELYDSCLKSGCSKAAFAPCTSLITTRVYIGVISSVKNRRS